MKTLVVAVVLVGLLVPATHLCLLDGLPGLVFRLLDNREDTVFSQGYCAATFWWLHKGASEETTTHLLGSPLAMIWEYTANSGHIAFRIEDGAVSEMYTLSSGTSCAVDIGESSRGVIERLGEPDREAWVYSESPSGSSYRIRLLIFEHGILTEKRHSYYAD